MDVFKQLLRAAVGQSAEQVIMSAGKAAIIRNAGGDQSLDNLGPAQPNMVMQVMAQLFGPKTQVLNQGKPVQGIMDLVGVGEVKTIAILSPVPTVYLFFPNGLHHFEKVWGSLNQPAAGSPPPPPVAATPASAAPVIPQDPGVPPAPPAGQPAVPPVPPAASESNSANASFSPANLSTPPVPDSASSAAVVPPSGVPPIPAGGSQPAPVVASEDPTPDMSAPPADLSAPPQNLGMPPSDLSAPPQDIAAPPSDLNPATPNLGVAPNDLSSAPANLGAPPSDLSEAPSDLSAPPKDLGTPPSDLSAPPLPTGVPDLGTQTSAPALPEDAVTPPPVTPEASPPIGGEENASGIFSLGNPAVSVSQSDELSAEAPIDSAADFAVSRFDNEPSVVEPMPNLQEPVVSAPPTEQPPAVVASAPQVGGNISKQGDSNEVYEIEFATPKSELGLGSSPKLDAILNDMMQKGASDLHLTAGEPIIYRLDGDIWKDTSKGILQPSLMREMLLPIMPEKNRKEFSKTHDTDFAYEIPGVGRFRVNVFRDRSGVGSVMRHIPSKIMTARELRINQSILNFCELHKGLVLVTGPTGSGKSTTLAAMIDHINKTRPAHIITIEDPVEFVYKADKCLINQREVGRHTQSFKKALRAALREDPDIILVGELRDLETIKIAIETAETGHLVFGTLHTNTAISTVDRIVDQFPAEQQMQIRVMLAESLKGVISQTLLKKVTKGRIAAQEILVVNRAISAILREGKTQMLANQMTSGRKEGNVLLNEVLLNLVIHKEVEPMEAYLKSVDKSDFLTMLNSKGIKLVEDEEAS